MLTLPTQEELDKLRDRELLELAAKAAGICLHPEDSLEYSYGNWGCDTTCGICRKDPSDVRFSPLNDDGDALRLAATLRLKVIPGKYKGDGCTVEAQRDGIAGCTAFRDDPSEQMRYAIVHVAAEIGKSLP